MNNKNKVMTENKGQISLYRAESFTPGEKRRPKASPSHQMKKNQKMNTFFAGFAGYRFYSTSGRGGWNKFIHTSAVFKDSKHSWSMVDRLDPLMDSISPEDLKPFNFSVLKNPQKIKSEIYGLQGYLFSSQMNLEIDHLNVGGSKEVILKAAKEFLKSLKPGTVYKCIFIAVTDIGEIKSSKEGGFYVTSQTRPEFLLMKVRTGIDDFVFNYNGHSFDSYSLCYKEWLLSKDIADRVVGVERVADMLNRGGDRGSSSSSLYCLDGPKTPHVNVDNYNRWLRIVGPIAEYQILDSSKHIVNMTETKDSEFKIDVECVESAELVSWVDKWVDKDKMLWVRTFKSGVEMFYEGSKYLYYENPFKTEVWTKALKDHEYNSKFGAFDIETFKSRGEHGDGLQIPYASGFTDYKGNVTMFYIQKGEQGFAVLVRTLEAMLTRKYNGGTFYVHNMARFDSRLILEALGRMTGVRCGLWGRDMNNIFKIRISKKIGSVWCNIVLLDSVYQLPFKLDVLGKNFDTDTQKSFFPYTFVNVDRLFYKGPVPALKYYNVGVTDAEYKGLVKESWDLKEETLIYLKKDLQCLHQVMHKYNKTIFKDFLVNNVKISSYSALSKLVFLSNFYDDTKFKLPVISGYLEQWIRRAYKGGIVDVVQHLVSDGVKYDSNSHYPAAMLNDMPVGNGRFTDEKDLFKLFGFCFVEVVAPTEEELKCTILPTEDEDGNMHCPRGVWKDVYFSEELKNAVKYGYKVTIISAIKFDRGVGIFNKFITEMFNRKAAAKEIGDFVKELVYKLMQNSLYGKSGQREILHRFKLIDNEKVEMFELKNKTDLTKTFGNKTLIRTQGKINAELEGVIAKLVAAGSIENDKGCSGDGLEDLPVSNSRNKQYSVKSSVSTAAAITAYARINISQYKNIDGNKYYGGDTDSVIMEKELDAMFVGKGLGQMKKECSISLGLFADKKLYLTVDDAGAIVVRSRGVGRSIETDESILNFNDFIKLFKGEELNINKTKFIIESDGIYVKPQTITVKISNSCIVKIMNEVSAILLNTRHRLFDLALKIGAFSRALIKYVEPNLDFIWYNTIHKGFIWYNTCSTDFIWYNTCSTEFTIWGFYMYKTILPAIIPAFILVDLDLIIWRYTGPAYSTRLDIVIYIANNSLIVLGPRSLIVLGTRSLIVWFPPQPRYLIVWVSPLPRSLVIITEDEGGWNKLRL